MKYLTIFALFVLYSTTANALCLDMSIVRIGVCSDELPSTPLTFYLIIWVLLNVLFGQVLIMRRVHLIIKYTLFLLTIPLSPLILLLTYVGTLAFRGFDKLKLKKVEEKQTSFHQVEVPVVKETLSHIQIGEYTFNRTEQSLVKGELRVALEPKCMQMLSYLIEQQPRIVSLEELHSNVWQDQIVTDTAVRRVISKLRNAFADTDTKNPQYIKSIMKRGYQLIAEVKTQPFEE